MGIPNTDLWVQYAKEFCGETNHLVHKVCINYNQWFVSESYRRDIAQQLNMDYSEETINKIPKFGRSSFDKNKYGGKASKMAVLDRWCNQRDDDKNVFWQHFGRNLNAFRLSKIIFPELPNDHIRAELDAQLSFSRKAT